MQMLTLRQQQLNWKQRRQMQKHWQRLWRLQRVQWIPLRQVLWILQIRKP